MKNGTCAVIVALALMPAIGAADQGQSKPKEKTTTSQSQGKEKGKKAGGPAAPASPGSSSVAGSGSCAPDTTAPVIQSVSASPNALSVPNHRMVPVAISANVTDNCSAAMWSVTAITSDEPVNGTGDGDTDPDWSITSPHAVSLRSERAGTGDGRVYTVTITAKDAANNTSTATTTVTVPHNR